MTGCSQTPPVPPFPPSSACVWCRALLRGDPQQGWSQGPRSLHLNPGPLGARLLLAAALAGIFFIQVQRVSPAQPQGSEHLRVASVVMPAWFGDRLMGLHWGLQPLSPAGVLFECSLLFPCKHSPVPMHTWFSFLSLLHLPCHWPARAQHPCSTSWHCSGAGSVCLFVSGFALLLFVLCVHHASIRVAPPGVPATLGSVLEIWGGVRVWAPERTTCLCHF